MAIRKKPEDLQKRGRKSNFKPEYIEKVYSMTLLGLTDVQMSGVLEVDEVTFNRWKRQFPEFRQSLKKGKEDADSKVAKSLYTLAIGYEYEEKSTEKNGRKIVKR